MASSSVKICQPGSTSTCLEKVVENLVATYLLECSYQTNIITHQNLLLGATDKCHSSIVHIQNSVDTNSDNGEDQKYTEQEFEPIIYDPSTLMPLSTQVAGHGSECNGEKGLLKRLDGRLLKPVQAPPRGRRELNFYQRITSSKDPTNIRLRKCIPDFFGVEKVEFRNGLTVTEEFLILQDITEGFARPCIMDIKIGSRTYGPDASAKKQALEDAKYVGTKQPLGFSVSGLMVHSLKSDANENVEGSHMKKYNKDFGKNLKTEDVHTVPEIFFDLQQSGDKAAECVKIMIRQIRTIYEALESQRKYKIYGSSLLMSYDADAVKRFEKENINQEELEKYVNVKLVDFAHVFSSEGERDDNFLRGLANVLSLFEEFYKTLFAVNKYQDSV